MSNQISAQAEQAREGARQSTGRFGQQSHTSPGTDVLGDSTDPAREASFANLHDQFQAELDTIRDVAEADDDERAKGMLPRGREWCQKFNDYAYEHGIDLGVPVRVALSEANDELARAELEKDEYPDDYERAQGEFFEVAEDMHRAILASGNRDVDPVGDERKAELKSALRVKGDLDGSMAARLDHAGRQIGRTYEKGEHWTSSGALEEPAREAMVQAELDSDRPDDQRAFLKAVDPGYYGNGMADRMSSEAVDRDVVDQFQLLAYHELGGKA